MALLINMDAPMNLSQLGILDILKGIGMMPWEETDENLLHSCRAVLEHADLDDEKDTPADHPSSRKHAMEVWIFNLLWSRPREASILANEYLPSFDVLEAKCQFRRITWYRVMPRHVLQVLSAGNTSPAVFRSEISEGPESQLADFTWEYWYQTAILRECYGGVEEWRALARWIFTDARAEELTSPRNDPSSGYRKLATPLLSAVNWNLNRHIQAVRSWLEDLASAGVDLERYGECESQQFAELKKTLLADGDESMEWRLYGFVYGPSPDHWYFFPRSEVEAYAGEFWELVEPAKMYVPGGWVDEDDEWT